MRQHTKLIVILAFVFPSFLVFASFLMAHETHHPTQTKPGQPGVVADHDEHEEDEHEVASGPPRPVPIPFTGDPKKHLHNKIVHFPLALGIVGSLFVLISLKRPEMLTAARILWFIGAAVGIAAYFTGTWQEESFEHGVMHNILEIHKNLGIVSVASMWIGFILTFVRRLRGLTVLVAIEIAAAIACTGYYGGLLAH